MTSLWPRRGNPCGEYLFAKSKYPGKQGRSTLRGCYYFEILFESSFSIFLTRSLSGIMEAQLNTPIMPRNQLNNKANLRYSRDKGKVEVDGDSSDVKWLASIDLCTSRLIKIVTITVAAFCIHKMQIFACVIRLF
jgi:hypothetical protein